MRLAAALCAVLLVFAWSDAQAYSPNVREARQWLRERTHDHAFRCAHRLWDNESGWAVHARGPMTRWGRAVGIPQSLPGSKMRSAGPDWRTNATTQVIWGTRYVRARYNSFCHALRWQNARGWY